MTDLDLAELRRLAEAVPVPLRSWNVDPTSGVDVVWDGRQIIAQALTKDFPAIAAHIAAFDRTTTLELIDCAERLERQTEALTKLADAAEANLKSHTLGTVNKLLAAIEAARRALQDPTP